MHLTMKQGTLFVIYKLYNIIPTLQSLITLLPVYFDLSSFYITIQRSTVLFGVCINMQCQDRGQGPY